MLFPINFCEIIEDWRKEAVAIHFGIEGIHQLFDVRFIRNIMQLVLQ
jgi:hypothetical protein